VRRRERPPCLKTGLFRGEANFFHVGGIFFEESACAAVSLTVKAPSPQTRKRRHGAADGTDGLRDLAVFEAGKILEV